MGQTVREPDRHRHEVVGLRARVAEHHPLVTRAHLVEEVAGAGPLLHRLVDTHGDVGRLLVDRGDDAAGVAVEAVRLAVVADAPHGVAHDPLLLGQEAVDVVEVRGFVGHGDRSFAERGILPRTPGAAQGFVLRHRFDEELQQLTIKSLGADTEVRDEVNLDLGSRDSHRDQEAQVESFVARLGLVWSGTILKDVEVWYYPECEIVRYEATTDSRRITCVEFEALQKDSLDGALATLDRFERATGFSGKPRAHLSLPQLLFPEFSAATARQA